MIGKICTVIIRVINENKSKLIVLTCLLISALSISYFWYSPHIKMSDLYPEMEIWTKKNIDQNWTSDDPRLVSIYYATNREIDVVRPLHYGGRRGEVLSFGTAIVRVPDNHVEGAVERPIQVTVISVILRQDENEKDHFVMRSLLNLNRDEFIYLLKQEKKDTALVFVHGYNNSFDDSAYRLAQIVFDGQLFGIVPVLFSWPSANKTLAYSYDGDSAEISVEYFMDLIRLLQRDAGIKTIHIIAHSMGNRIVLNAIERSAERLKESARIGELIFAAADIDRQRFIQIAKNVKRVAKGMTLYASQDDEALWWSKEIAFKMPRAGYVTADGPLVTDGVESVDMTAANRAKSLVENIKSFDPLGLNTHNSFVSPVIVDLSRLIKKGEHPPNMRTSKIHGVPERAAVPSYWRYVE